MLKKQLENKLQEAWDKTKKLEQTIEEWETASDEKRKMLSKMLGHFKESYYDEDKTLTWGEIYFELGKLTQRANDDRDQVHMTNDIKFLLECEHRREKQASDKFLEEEAK